MTPLFPNPDHYKFNLIAMTSPEAKRLWRRAIKEYFDNTCIYCGITHDINDLTLDHVHPRHLGGKDDTHNLACSCLRCNQEKGTNNWKQFIQQFGNPLREQVLADYIYG